MKDDKESEMYQVDNIKKADYELLSQIANRAVKMFADAGIEREKIDCLLDIEAVHSATGLRLNELLNASDADFAHDMAGIAKHMNRETGKLEDGFLPRFHG